jgi:hypothetical protein
LRSVADEGSVDRTEISVHGSLVIPISIDPGLFSVYSNVRAPMIGLLAGSITFTWIYNSTGGSVLMTIFWNGLFNYATACSACKT